MPKPVSKRFSNPIRFSKYHALGNDYLVVDPADLGLTGRGASRIPWSARQVARICDRHRGVGSDGILWGPIWSGPGTEPGVRIFNPDGSEAEKSGNGVRIFSRYLRDSGYVGRRFCLKTRGGSVAVEFLGDQPDSLIRIDMGPPEFLGRDRQQLRIGERRFEATTVSMGNPHCVIRLPKITEALCREAGPKIETHRWFPERTNVQFVRVVDRRTIELQIWERGAGYTLASGSSSCAAVAVCVRQGWTDRKVRVKMPGGDLRIELDSRDHVWMTGPVVAVAEGIWMPEMVSSR